MRRENPSHRGAEAEWLRDVPSAWDIKHLKHIATINDDKLPDDADPLRPMAYVDIGSVSLQTGIGSTEAMVFEDAPSRARRLVRDGDTIISTVRTYLRAIAPIRNPTPEMVVSTGFAVVRPMLSDPAFVYWALREHGLVEQIVARSVGVSYPAINPSVIGCLPVPQPPPSAQLAIASFLDRETARIDKLISMQESLIERLDEYRTALITRVVTKGLPAEAAEAAGLDPAPRLKDSGVEWLGEVPEHWDACQLRRQFGIVNGGTPATSDDENWDGETVWLTPDDLGRNEGKAISEGRRNITSEGLRSSGARLSPPDSVVLSTRAPIGHLAVTAMPAATNQGCRTLVPRAGAISGFAYYSLLASREVLQAAGKGSTFMELSATDLAQHWLPKPPPNEQKAMAEYLDAQSDRIDTLRSKAELSIERLSEYRCAVISAAVTGKIDVRDGALAGAGGGA